MHRLIYASRATSNPGTDDLASLLEISRTRNEEHDVTGLLLYTSGSFMQVLEGPETSVDDTYERICKDERHEAIRLLTREPITDREYPDWSMGFAHPDDESLARDLPGFKPATEYPLVSSDLVRNGDVAATLLRLYARNT